MSRLFSLFLLALIGLTAPSWATHIYVSGDQTGTWSADTVIVTGEVRVPPGQSLTILPGVEVLFSVYCKLIVDNGATLRAVGTAADSIRFDVLLPDSSWHGIRFISASDSSRLEYCHLMHGLATGGGENDNGGAIYCSSSSPTISHNTISGNSAGNPGGPEMAGKGGGIYCENNSNPTISDNIISENFNNFGGGGICCENNSSPSIIGNTICGNWCGWTGGGGIYCHSSSPSIRGNTITGNFGGGEVGVGGGIYCNGGSPIISRNTISENSTGGSGGGISCGGGAIIIGNTISGNVAGGGMMGISGGGITCGGGSPSIIGNTISMNIADHSGGSGIYCGGGSPRIIGNTISENSVGGGPGGGIYCTYNSSPTLVNCILWGNSLQQIYVYSGSPQVSYSDIQGGYAGTGNIDVWPAFVDTAQGDYRLQWGSPCIDTGDPNPIYNDPDNTRADMGAWYYDQSMPQRVLLTPYNAPIQIPAIGGSFQYNIQVTNIGDTTIQTLGWCDVTLPSGTPYGPVLGPVNISLGSGQTLSRLRTQAVPAGAPAGMYHYNAYAVAAGDTSTDSFVFTKLGGGGRTPALQPGSGGWTNTGEEFYVGARHAVPASGSGATPTTVISPNPFNPTTVARYQMPDARYVSLRVYDTAGRLVTTLVDGWSAAGEHQVTFDGSGLAAGVYVYRLQAGDFSASGKMVLLK